jgi:hypothetical protein
VKRAMILAIGLAVASIWVVMAAGGTAVWLTEEARALSLVMVPLAILASLLVLYFEWRTQLRRKTLAESAGHELAQAA